MSYTLNVNFSEEALEKLQDSGHVVTIVKVCDDNNHTQSNAEKANSDDVQELAWVTFRPWQEGAVKWEEKYSVYASDTKITKGVVIERVAHKEAEKQDRQYLFKGGYFHENEYEGQDENSYYVRNEGGEMGTFGLAQTVRVKSDKVEIAPINAFSMLNNEDGYFTPIEKIKIFLSSDASNGKVISHAQSDALLVDFTERAERTVEYDPVKSVFRIAK